MFRAKCSKSVSIIVVLAMALGLSAVQPWGVDGIIEKVALPSNDYCHLKLPAIRQTYAALKTPNAGDVVDDYGPCNHDPLAKDELQNQRLEWEHEQGAS